LTEWQAYYELEPFGPERADMNAAVISSTIANVNRDSNSQAFSVEDFMPKFGETSSHKKQSVEEMIAGARLYTAHHNQKSREDNT